MDVQQQAIGSTGRPGTQIAHAHAAHPHEGAQAHTHVHVHDAGAHGAHTTGKSGAGAAPPAMDEDFVLKFFEEWREINEKIAVYNDLKKMALSTARAAYGPDQTDALKRACNLALNGDAEIAKSAALGKLVDAYLKVIKLNPDHS